MQCVRRWVKCAVAWALPLLVAGCAGMQRDASLPLHDPNERMNRGVMALNLAVMRPAAEVVSALPGPVHDRLRDFNANLREPRVFVNNLLQGRFAAAHATGGRFLVNSVLGVGGLFDIASRAGLEQQSGDFGQTLFAWGVGAGPYVMRPYQGPATMRDAWGSVVDMFANPVGWITGSQIVPNIGTTVLDAAERLGDLKKAENASIDFYSFVRSSYYQKRRAELREAIGLPGAVDSPALEDPAATVPGPSAQSRSCAGQPARGTCAVADANPWPVAP